MAIFLLILLLLGAGVPASAQLTGPAKDAPIAMGHHHFFVSDIEAHVKFWIEQLGAHRVDVGDYNIVKLPNLIVFFTEEAPDRGTKGSIVNHVGLQVKGLRALVERLKAAGVEIATRSEIPEAEDDLFYIEDQDTYTAFVMAPDGVKIELIDNVSLDVPIANHHIHFFTPEVEAMKAWYVELFGAKPGKRGRFEAADLPGVNLTFSKAEGDVVGTQGTALNHTGFEVENLKAFSQKLEAEGIEFDRPYTERPDLGFNMLFFTDPWGTYIELMEGLDRL